MPNPPEMPQERLPSIAMPEVHNIPATLSAARVLHVVEPEYPKQARKKKIQGDVTLKATIDQKGRVTAVSVLSGSPILAQAAADAVRT